MLSYLGEMPIWAWIFLAAFGSVVWTGLLAFYLEMRRWNLVETGQLPRSTPKIFHTLRSTMGKAFFGWIAINYSYVFSREITVSPDHSTRFWAPKLRIGLILSPVLFSASVLAGFLAT